MSGNTFGTHFRLTTYGESHGPALGGVIDGCLPGVPLDAAVIQRDLDRRRPAGFARRHGGFRALLAARPGRAHPSDENDMGDSF